MNALKTRLLSLALVAAGCTPAAAPVQTLDELLNRFATTLCKEAFECCGVNAPAVAGTPDLATCITATSQRLNEQYAQARADIAAGKSTFDSEQATLCSARLESFSCSAAARVIVDPSCFRVIKGLTPVGGACEIPTTACEPGSNCFSSMGAPPQCLAANREGEACQARSCDGTSGLTCGVDDLCVDFYSDGHECTRDDQCLGDRCVGGTCQSLTLAVAVCGGAGADGGGLVGVDAGSGAGGGGDAGAGGADAGAGGGGGLGGGGGTGVPGTPNPPHPPQPPIPPTYPNDAGAGGDGGDGGYTGDGGDGGENLCAASTLSVHIMGDIWMQYKDLTLTKNAGYHEVAWSYHYQDGNSNYDNNFTATVTCLFDDPETCIGFQKCVFSISWHTGPLTSAGGQDICQSTYYDADGEHTTLRGSYTITHTELDGYCGNPIPWAITSFVVD